jgi:hypothetical protein
MNRVLVALVLLLLASSASAGNNASGKAWLSWDREGTSSQIGQPPSYQFPLYLHLADAPDIAVLGVGLRWSMGDSSRCYDIVPSPPDIGCGWATDSLPNGNFEGDSTYAWKISFQGSERSCVSYAVSAATCSASSAATFWLASVVTKDSNGAVDSLEVLEQASIGSMAQAPPPQPDVATVPGIVLLEFNAGEVEAGASPMGLRHLRRRELREFLRSRGFVGARKMYRESRAADTLLVARDGHAVRVPDVSRWYVVKLNEGIDVDRLLDTLRTVPGVARARPGKTVRRTAVPNDGLFGQQWHLNAPAGVGATQAWNSGQAATT